MKQMETSLSQSQAATMSAKQECDRLRAVLEEYAELLKYLNPFHLSFLPLFCDHLSNAM